MKYLWLSLLFLSLAATIAPMAIAEVPRVGIVLPLTGRLANVGRDMQDAILLREESGVAFQFEDDGFEPRNTVSAVQKLLAHSFTRALITFGSGTSLAAKPILEKSKLPAIAIAMTDKIVEGSPNIFRYYLPVKAQAETISAEITRRRYKNVIFVASQQEAMLSFVTFFKKQIGVPEANFVEIIPGEADLRGIALRVAARRPDGVCLLLLPPELSSFPRQLRSLGFTGEFFGTAQMSNPDAILAAQGTLESSWITTADDASAADFYKRFSERFGRIPTPEALNAYDSAGLLIMAIRSSDPVRSLSNHSEYRGIFGRGLAFEPPNTFRPPLIVKRISKNSLVPAD